MQRISERFPLAKGSHPSRVHGMCAMEMTAWLAGEEHSDEPRCTCPVISAFVRALNDALPDEQRSALLRPLVPRLVNTRGDAALERARGRLVADMLVRSLVPMGLVRVQRTGAARCLSELPAVVDQVTAQKALQMLRECAPEPQSAMWMLERTAQGWLPARYVPAAVRAAKELGPEVLAACVPVLVKMVELTTAPRDLASLEW
jgi:hypothetical protein